jgi:hypothetical protein
LNLQTTAKVCINISKIYEKRSLTQISCQELPADIKNDIIVAYNSLVRKDYTEAFVKLSNALQTAEKFYTR